VQRARRSVSRRSRAAREASAAARPPYAVPSMAEIEASPLNGLVVASTFAGAGGSSTGYRMAGFRVGWASEFEPHAGRTYARNHPGTILDRRDIRTVSAAEIVAALGQVPDVFDGSPPCQSFSMAGPRTNGWGKVLDHSDGTRQRSDDLFAEYARILADLQPRAFVAENVAGLVAGAAKGQFKRIMASLTDCGYRVRARLLDAQWLGVPQRRKRVIIIGLRADLGIEPAFPAPLSYRYSMLDACPWLAGFDGMTDGSGFQDELHDIAEPAPTITASPVATRDRWELRHRNSDGHVPVTLQRPGHGWYPGEDRPLDQPSPTILGGSGPGPYGKLTYPGTQRRPTWAKSDTSFDGPAPAIAATGINGASIDQALVNGSRPLSIAELKRLCSFPDDYVLDGPYAKQWARLGNGVPPLMMRAVATALAAQLCDTSEVPCAGPAAG
jgi:DNA (cytosine-5)-methyltransferase 1